MSAHIELHPHAGSDIVKVSADAQRIADLLGITIEFRFNDVLCMASPGGDAAALAERQQAEQARKLSGPYDRRFASSRVSTAA
jgi:hypothetical protein